MFQHTKYKRLNLIYFVLGGGGRGLNFPSLIPPANIEGRGVIIEIRPELIRGGGGGVLEPY